MARIESVEALRRIYKQPAGRALTKVIDHIDRHCRRFIELSPFLVIGSSRPDGTADVSPRGEAPGFVQVLGPRTLGIPDRPGNNRLDTLTSVLENPRIGLIFLIPGVQETLRINGLAEIRDDPELLDRFVVRGKAPATVLRVEAQEVYLHCAKSILRSRIWEPEARIDRAQLPTMAEMIGDHSGQDGPLESQEDMIARYQSVLY